MYTQQELESAGLHDFRVFLWHVWRFLTLPEPTPVQKDIAKWLQRADRRIILSAFRGVGKSWITVSYVLWLLLHAPQKKIMVVSASGSLADDFSQFAKQLIEGMPLLQHLAPRPGQRDRADKWDVGPATESKDPSVKSVGITGQLTGSRADVIIADDVEVPKNSATHLMREKLAELVKEFDAVLKPGGRVIYLGTPQVEDSLYNKLLDRKYKMQVWPAEIPQSPSSYGGRLAPFVMRRIQAGAKAGEPLDPGRFDREDLMERKASYGISGYALQFMLDVNPAEADKHPLKLSDLLVTDLHDEIANIQLVWSSERQYVVEDLEAGGYDGDYYRRPSFKSPEMTKWQGTVMAIDPSGQGTDETSYAIMRYVHGLLCLVEVGGFTDGFGDKTLETLAKRAGHHKVNWVIAEENYGGGMFNKLLEPYLLRHAKGRFDDEWNGWSHTMKEHRILDILEPIVRSHKLVVDRRVIEADLEVQKDRRRYSFIQQFTRMERLKGALPNEDRLEAVAMAAGYFTERMNRDQEKAVNHHKSKLIDEELRKFKQHVFGRPTRARTKWA